MHMPEGEILQRAVMYEELLRLLREALKNDAEALKLAEALIAAYRLHGSRGVREELKKLIKEVIERDSEAQEA